MDFSSVEAEFERLKTQFEAGELTEAEFKSQLQELMIENEQGEWWTIGPETGQWYVHNGEQWVQKEPPRPAAVSPPSRSQQQVAAEPREREETPRQEELTALYDEAAGLLKAKRYQQALDKWGEVQAIDPNYPDSKKVQATATKKLAAGGRPAPWRRLPRWAIATVAGLVLVAVVVAAMQMCGGAAPSVARPTATRALKATAAPSEKATSTPAQVAGPTSVPVVIWLDPQNKPDIQGVTSYYYHYTDSSYFYVLGEVANGTGEDLGAGLWVEGVFYDSAGEEVTTEDAVLGLDRLAAGDTLPFGMIIETDPDHPIDHYELRFNDEQQYEMLGLVDLEASDLRVSDDLLWLFVQVRNPHSFTVRRPKAVATCYDASGKVVLVGSTAPITGQPDSLNPDQAAWLTLNPLSTLPEGPKSPGVAQCRLQALATQE
jgi:hypothetical protein